MKNLILKFISLLAAFPLIGGLFAQAAEGQIAKANGIEIWYETFGQKENPALLLIMGACSQGINWPTEFCKRLATEGFYVVRYDHRDSGLSTCFDFEKNPYDLVDLSKDAIGLLDFLGIEKAHLFGFSMGGPIAEIMSVRFPERVLSIGLVATSADMGPAMRGFDRLPPEEGVLSPPAEEYLSWTSESSKCEPKTEAEKFEQKLSGWRMLNGSALPFEEELYREILTEFEARTRHPSSAFNQLSAIKGSLDIIRKVPSQVTVPTVIFHGSADPIFPLDHGEFLALSIPHSKYVLLEGAGHFPNRLFYDLMIHELKENVMANQFVKQDQKFFIGFEMRTSNSDMPAKVKGHWDRFYKEYLHRIPNRVDDSILALYTDYEGDYTQPFSYIIGCEVSNLDEIPKGLVGKVIPKSKYALFMAEGAFPQSMVQTWQKIWKADIKRSYTSDFEFYGPDFNPAENPKVKIFIAIEE